MSTQKGDRIRISPLPLAGEVGARSVPGEGGGWKYAFVSGCATLIRLRHLLPPAGEGKSSADKEMK